MSKINYSVENLRKRIEESRKLLDNSSSKKKYVTAFMPEGIHKIRWLFDPNGEYIDIRKIHNYSGIWTLCPDWLAQINQPVYYPDSNEVIKCKICEHDLGWRVAARWLCKAYGHVLETNNPNERFQAGKTYCILVTNLRLQTALTSCLEANVEEAEAANWVIQMLTPSIRGGVTRTEVVMGPQGFISIQAIMGKYCDPIEVDENWYIPLSEQWISPTFKIDRYLELCEKVREDFLSDPLDSITTMEDLNKYILSNAIEVDIDSSDDVEAIKRKIRSVDNSYNTSNNEVQETENKLEEQPKDDAGTPPDEAKGEDSSATGKSNSSNEDSEGNNNDQYAECARAKKGLGQFGDFDVSAPECAECDFITECMAKQQELK